MCEALNWTSKHSEGSLSLDWARYSGTLDENSQILSRYYAFGIPSPTVVYQRPPVGH